MDAMARGVLERETGELFGSLWAPYDDKLFEESVDLFKRRLEITGFDTSYFKGATTLCAGCGGGRNAIAMAQLGAAEVHGVDIAAKGIANAWERAGGLDHIAFHQASILDLPFDDGKFDLVCCAGVLMIADDEDRALDELTRVLKPGGFLYLLVYADQGMRWPLINTLRPIAAKLGQAEIERAMARSGMAANKQRTFLDDLFCPKLDFYNWNRLLRMLRRRGYSQIERWGEEARLDHEQSLADYREDLEHLAVMFQEGGKGSRPDAALHLLAYDLVRGVIHTVRWFEAEIEAGETTQAEAMAIVIGQGHHRVLSRKGI